MTTPNAAPALSIRHLVKRFGDVTAVRDLTLDVTAGEFFTLLGPSGCGKSTTLMTIAGLEEPDAGEIILHGQAITSLPPERRGMGLVFQSYALFPHMTILQNIAFPLAMRGVRSRDTLERARRALKLVQLDVDENARPSEISGGQAQRVALARALVFEPAVLLMDEPLAALDRRLREAMQFELRHLKQRIGTTVIYVTHDQEEALALSDRIGVMRDGRFEQVGTPLEVYASPATAFVANFLGDSNRVPVRRVSTSSDWDEFVAIKDRSARFRVPASSETPDDGLFVVRPEHVTLAGEDIPAGYDCQLAAVTDVAFMGDHLRTEATVAGNAWTIRTRPAISGEPEPQLRGPHVQVCWPRAAARVVPWTNGREGSGAEAAALMSHDRGDKDA
jgi:putative spermidine/putrescine transport system ATP-binding protein